MSGREPTSASFEPQRLTPPRRRVDPAVIGVVVIVLAIGAAILKPWGELAPSDATATPLGAVPSPVVPAEVVPAPSASAGTPLASAVVTASIVTWQTAAVAIRPHDRWGIRAIVPAFADGRSPVVILGALRGAAWEPGTYRIDASWTDASGRRTAAYHVQLRPGAGLGPASIGGAIPG